MEDKPEGSFLLGRWFRDSSLWPLPTWNAVSGSDSVSQVGVHTVEDKHGGVLPTRKPV